MTPNQPPTDDPGSLRLAIVGEAPALEEESYRRCPRHHGYPGQQWQEGRLVELRCCPTCGSPEWTPDPTPFVGPSGRLLNWLLAEGGLKRERCWVGNVCQEPASTLQLDFPGFPPLVRGLEVLTAELTAWRPCSVLALGNTALHAMHPAGWTRVSSAKNAPFVARITDWRGSIFAGCAARPWKVVASLHPAACLRFPEWTCLLGFDVKRAVEEAADPELNLLEREIWMPVL